MLVFLVILLFVAVFTDFRSGKIPNLLILMGSMAGIVMGQQVCCHVLQALFVILLFFPFYLIRALGAGDIKCIAMSSLYLTA